MSRNRMEADSRGAVLTAEIDKLTKELGELHDAHSQNLNDLSRAIGDDFKGINESTYAIMNRISIQNKTVKLLTQKRKQLRAERSRMRNQFIFREDEVLRMMDIIGREMEENPLDTMLHEIFTELDTIAITTED